MENSKNNGRFVVTPWDEQYKKMREECPQNDTEREILRMLGEGKSIIDCLELWREKNNNEDGFREFMKRAERWESEHLCRKNV